MIKKRLVNPPIASNSMLNRFKSFKTLLIPLLLISICSCSTRKEIVYFQGIESIKGMPAPKDFTTKIEVNDVLRIDVSSINNEVVEPFRFNVEGRAQGGGGSSSSLYGYLVDVDGSINFPVLGEVEVVGKTREEIEELLTAELKDYVRDAVVRVRLMNFKVTVMGEARSQVIDVPDERLSVLQAVAMAGDITYNGKRENVLVVRMENGEMTYGRVDLTSAQVFNNPFYYLKQNDIVYIEPTYRKVKSAGFITSWQGLVSIVTTAFSLFVLFNNI
jgi:polysaccharide biosynthesis/export protein